MKWLSILVLFWTFQTWSQQQCINSIRSIVHGVARDANGKIMQYVPITKNSIILDSQLLTARGSKADFSMLSEGDKRFYKFLRNHEKRALKHGDELHYWLPDQVIKETAAAGNPMDHPMAFPAGTRRLGIKSNRNSSEYQYIMSKLEEIKLGQRKKQSGDADRMIVADIFFAETAKGVVPKFATSDRGIIEPLCRLSIDCTKALNKRMLFSEFPDGFEVSITDLNNIKRVIKILPVPGMNGF